MECHWWGKCPSTTQACTWDTAFDWHDCQSMHAICTRGNGGGGSGTCRWSHSKSYRQCSKKRAGADPKNPDDPARSAPAGVSAVATSSSRRWKNNLLLKSWRCTYDTHTHTYSTQTHIHYYASSSFIVMSILIQCCQIPPDCLSLSLSARTSTESNFLPTWQAIVVLHCTHTHTISPPHYLYTYYTYYIYT